MYFASTFALSVAVYIGLPAPLRWVLSRFPIFTPKLYYSQFGCNVACLEFLIERNYCPLSCLHVVEDTNLLNTDLVERFNRALNCRFGSVLVNNKCELVLVLNHVHCLFRYKRVL